MVDFSYGGFPPVWYEIGKILLKSTLKFFFSAQWILYCQSDFPFEQPPIKQMKMVEYQKNKMI
jgi:hypothetical protein